MYKNSYLNKRRLWYIKTIDHDKEHTRLVTVPQQVSKRFR